jgi:hypothetical protein
MVKLTRRCCLKLIDKHFFQFHVQKETFYRLTHFNLFTLDVWGSYHVESPPTVKFISWQENTPLEANSHLNQVYTTI